MKIILIMNNEEEVKSYIKTYLDGMVEVAYSYKTVKDAYDSLSKIALDVDKMIIDDISMGDEPRDSVTLLDDLLCTKFFTTKELIHLKVENYNNEVFTTHLLSKYNLICYEYNCTVARAIDIISGKNIKIKKEEDDKKVLVRKQVNKTSDIFIKKDENKSVIISDEEGIMSMLNKLEGETRLGVVLKDKTLNRKEPSSVDMPTTENIEGINLNLEKPSKEVKAKPETTIIAVTGDDNSGKTTLSLALGASAKNVCNKVLLIDLNMDTMGLSYNYELLGMESLFLVSEALDDIELLIVKMKNNVDKLNCLGITTKLLKHENLVPYLIEIIINTVKDKYDTIILDIDIKNFNKYINIFNMCHKIVLTYCINPPRTLKLAKIIKKQNVLDLTKVNKLTLVPSDMLVHLIDKNYLLEECNTILKSILKDRGDFFSPLKIQSFNIDETLYKAVEEGV